MCARAPLPAHAARRRERASAPRRAHLRRQRLEDGAPPAITGGGQDNLIDHGLLAGGDWLGSRVEHGC
jgi:hypothetical protein